VNDSELQESAGGYVSMLEIAANLTDEESSADCAAEKKIVPSEDFLCYYAENYHRHVVKAVLIKENWDDMDFEVEYVRYMDEYREVKEEFEKNNANDDEIEANLTKRREEYLTGIYDYIFDSMKYHLEKEKGPLSPQVLGDIKSRLSEHRHLTHANIQYLHTLRQIEEEHYKEQK